MIPLKKIEDTQVVLREIESNLNRLRKINNELYDKFIIRFEEIIENWEETQKERPVVTREFFKNSQTIRWTFELNIPFMKHYSYYDGAWIGNYPDRFDILQFIDDYLIRFENFNVEDIKFKRVEQVKSNIIAYYDIKLDNTDYHFEFYIKTPVLVSSDMRDGRLLYDNENHKIYFKW